MSTVLENSGGPGSSITLDPEIVSMRDRYLKALDGKPFDEMNSMIRKQLESEKEDINRLSLLAARVYILRLRTLELRGEPTDQAMPWSKQTNNENNESKDKVEVSNETPKEDNEWRRLRMIEAGEVNGVRFPPGIIIDVNASDGEKLVKSKKAEFVESSNPESEDTENNESSNDENSIDDNEKISTEVSEESPSEETNETSDSKDELEKDASSDEKNQDDKLSDDLAELSDSITEESENKEGTKDSN